MPDARAVESDDVPDRTRPDRGASHRRSSATPDASDDDHVSVGDLRPLAAAVARHKAPLLILFRTPGCPFCREVRRAYLAPRVAEQAHNATPALLLSVPVVALFDQTLQWLVEPLVGLERSGFYEGYLAARSMRRVCD